MTTYTLRPGQIADLEEAVPMFNLSSQKMIGADEFDMQEYIAEWTSPSINLEGDTRVAVAPDGKILGVIEVWNNTAPHVLNWVWARVHPDYEGQGIGTAMMEWAEQRAREKLTLAEPDTRVMMRTGQFAVNIAAKELFENLGFNGVRYSFTMERVMDAPPEPPMIPEGIVIRPMIAPDEYEAIHLLDQEAFRDHWGHVERPFEDTFAQMMHFLNERGDHDPALWFVAMDGERLAGISMCRLHASGNPESGWVDTLAVRKEYRKHGVGLALLLHSFNEFYQRGQRKAQLGVDAGNLTGALRLYQRAGMNVIRQFDLYEKELRGGRDLSTQG
jgi:mycothiol synthase